MDGIDTQILMELTIDAQLSFSGNWQKIGHIYEKLSGKDSIK